MTAVAHLKQTHRTVWASGDYAAVAECIDDAPPAELLARVPIVPGDEVLDVAAGTGNVAIKAALAGARVTALDLTPELLVTAERRAERAGVAVDWVPGDAEELPFEDASFDAVLSVFGVQFAPRHQYAADELARVCRPGGRIGLVNWTPDGHIGQLFKLLGRYLPTPPDFVSPPPLWGNEAHVRSLLPDVTWTFAKGHNPWRFASAEEWTAFMETNYGPTLKARERLIAEDRWDECRAEIVALAESFNAARDGSLLINAEYLVAVGTR
jgi:ubiquinone/menaquinone biosynthesis C-methylase UbiE